MAIKRGDGLYIKLEPSVRRIDVFVDPDTGDITQGKSRNMVLVNPAVFLNSAARKKSPGLSRASEFPKFVCTFSGTDTSDLVTAAKDAYAAAKARPEYVGFTDII